MVSEICHNDVNLHTIGKLDRHFKQNMDGMHDCLHQDHMHASMIELYLNAGVLECQFRRKHNMSHGVE